MRSVSSALKTALAGLAREGVALSGLVAVTFWLVIFGGLFLLVRLGMGIARGRKAKTHREVGRMPLDGAVAFEPTFSMKSKLGGAALEIDTTSDRFCVTYGKARSVFDFADLIAVELMRNGASFDLADRGSQIAGAALGAALLGPAGLLLGGLSGSRRREQRIARLSIKLFTTDVQQPVHEIVFYDGAPIRVDHPTARRAATAMDQWHGRLMIILHGNGVSRSTASSALDLSAP